MAIQMNQSLMATCLDRPNVWPLKIGVSVLAGHA